MKLVSVKSENERASDGSGAGGLLGSDIPDVRGGRCGGRSYPSSAILGKRRVLPSQPQNALMWLVLTSCHSARSNVSMHEAANLLDCI